jgi:hypothetical protein
MSNVCDDVSGRREPIAEEPRRYVTAKLLHPLPQLHPGTFSKMHLHRCAQSSEDSCIITFTHQYLCSENGDFPSNFVVGTNLRYRSSQEPAVTRVG